MIKVNDGMFQRAIECEIKERLNEAVKKAIEAAKNKIEEEILADVDKIALKLAKEYSVQDMGTHILIHVKKDL